MKPWRSPNKVRALIVAWVAMMGTMIVVRPALAQDHHARHHASYQNWHNKNGTDCCNGEDCGELSDLSEREVAGTLEVNIEGQWCPVKPYHYLRSGNVPNAAVSHACVLKKGINPGGPCERFVCYQPRPGS